MSSKDMKDLQVEMHPALINSWYCSDVKREVHAAGARLIADNTICDPALVMFRWHTPLDLATDSIPPRPSSSTDEQPTLTRRKLSERALYVRLADEVAELVGRHGLAKHVALTKDMIGCNFTLVIYGTKDYFRTNGRRTKNSNPKSMSESDLDMAITDLIASVAGCDALSVDTSNELALLIVQFMKASRSLPAMKAQRIIDDRAEFYMRGCNKNCVTIDKHGNGKSSLWQQMLAVLPLSSLETSRAICAQYKTPKALFEECQSSDAVKKIADIGVTRAAVPEAKARRVGPEFARKLHTLFTSDNGQTLI